MWKYLNKGISTPIAISIILILAITLGIFIWWQNIRLNNNFVQLPLINIDKQCRENSDCINTCCGCMSKKEKCDIYCEVLPEKECICINGQCIIGEESCKKQFLSWCDNCQSNNWEGYLIPEINVCLMDYFDLELPKTVTCESALKICKEFGFVELIADQEESDQNGEAIPQPNQGMFPEEVAANGLNWHMTYGALSYKDNPYFTEDFKNKIEKSLESQFMVDPVMFAQDYGLIEKVSKAVINDKYSYLKVTMFGKIHLGVELLLIDNQWKINNTFLLE